MSLVSNLVALVSTLIVVILISVTINASPTKTPTGQPSTQPTSTPTCPSSQPTRQPSSQPTRQPSRQPTSQPTAQPSNPTSVPTSAPTFNVNTNPTLTAPDNYDYKMYYYCHPLHYKSSANVYQAVFSGLTITSSVTIASAKIWLSSYDSEVDQLGLLTNDFTDSVRTIYSEGVLTLTQDNADLMSQSTDWEYLLNHVGYRIGIENGKLLSCKNYLFGVFSRTISVQITDRYSRVSNTISVTLVVKSAGLMYSEDVSIVISNSDTQASILFSDPSAEVSMNATINDLTY